MYTFSTTSLFQFPLKNFLYGRTFNSLHYFIHYVINELCCNYLNLTGTSWFILFGWTDVAPDIESNGKLLKPFVMYVLQEHFFCSSQLNCIYPTFCRKVLCSKTDQNTYSYKEYFIAWRLKLIRTLIRSISTIWRIRWLVKNNILCTFSSQIYQMVHYWQWI